MKRLYLLRHAKSSWDHPGLADHDRPLAPRGRRASKTMAEHLQWRDIKPELVVCSSAKRTRQTLSGIAGALGEVAEVEIEPDLYAASASELLEVLHGIDDRVDSVMLIGHNPGIENLTLDLAREGPELSRVRQKFPTAALATLEFDVSWGDLEPESCELVSFVKPKELARSA